MKCFLWLLVCAPAFANTYFLSNTGSDANSGVSPSQPWQSLARVNAGSFLPGDFILLKRGDTWREQLLPPSSGSSELPVTFAAYGAGANPVISGADLVSGFAPVGSAGQWCASLAMQPNVVFIAGARAQQQASPSPLSRPGQWNWSAGQLCVFSPSEPPAHVEAAQRDYALLLGQTGSGSYVTVAAIDFQLANMDTVHIANTTGDIIDSCLITGAYQFGVFAIGVNGTMVDRLTLRNNMISFHGSSGIEISSGHTNITLEHNTVFGNASNTSATGNFAFMAGIYVYSYSQSPNNDVIQYNVSHDNGVVGGTESQGAGIWLDTLTNATMQYNVAYNNVSHGLYLEKNVNTVMSGNLSFSNASAANSANITCYADFGVPATGNTVSGNISWNSHTWGMKLGAYQGGGPTVFQGNTVENNVVLNSATLALFVDNGANNNLTDGWNNHYLSNSFGPESTDFIYWTGVGWISTYAQLQAAYGASMGSPNMDLPAIVKTLNSLPLSPFTVEAIMAAAASH